MNISALILLTCCLSPASDPSKDAVQKEITRLQGTWVAISAETGGQKASEEAIKDFLVIIDGNKITFTPQTNKRESRFELDISKLPKEIVATPLDGPRKGKARRGIYSLEKGVLKLCVNNDLTEDEALPKAFATKKGDGLQLLVLKRLKSATAK